MERLLYAAGMSPREVRYATLRDAMQVARGYVLKVRDQRHDESMAEGLRQILDANAEQTAQLVAAIHNFTRPKPKTPLDPDDLIREIDDEEDVDTGTAKRVMSKERERANWQRHLERTSQSN